VRKRGDVAAKLIRLRARGSAGAHPAFTGKRRVRMPSSPSTAGTRRQLAGSLQTPVTKHGTLVFKEALKSSTLPVTNQVGRIYA